MRAAFLTSESDAKIAYSVWAHQIGSDIAFEHLTAREIAAWEEVVTVIVDEAEPAEDCACGALLTCPRCDGVACNECQGVLVCPSCDEAKANASRARLKAALEDAKEALKLIVDLANEGLIEERGSPDHCGLALAESALARAALALQGAKL